MSAAIGIGLAFVLARAISRPISFLTQGAAAIGQGDFGVRFRVLAEDEIGFLARTFNRMAEHLERYRGEVVAKERERLRLIERIIQTQEDERKVLSAELHDQLGQSLSALLLLARAHGQGGGACDPAGSPCRAMEERICVLIEDNGRGFDPQARVAAERRCLGLTGMRERAALLGGTFSIDSIPGQGTTVRARIPLAAEEARCPSGS